MFTWLKNFFALPPNPTNIKGLRFLTNNTIVVEYPPQKRTVLLENIYTPVKYIPQERAFLQFPYLVFIIDYYCDNNKFQFANLYVALNFKPLHQTTDRVYELPLSNISHYQVCLGEVAHKSRNKYFQTLEEMTNIIIEYFWSTTFSVLVKPKWQEITDYRKLKSLLEDRFPLNRIPNQYLNETLKPYAQRT